MKRKITHIILIVTTALVANSCSKWLEVYPRTQLPEHEMFASEQGFVDAMTGVYIGMSSESAYGNTFTQRQLAWAASEWSNLAGGALDFQRHQWHTDDARRFIESMYKEWYMLIARINTTLQNMERYKDVFTTPNLYETLKGEALALRAFLHFDLIRFFGPNPERPELGGEHLTYATTVDTDLKYPISFEAYKTKLFEDIVEAQKLLRNIDPIKHFAPNDTRVRSTTIGFLPTNDYFLHRAIKMNYFGAVALEARMRLWYGENARAFEAAMEVINATNPNGEPKFPLGTIADINAQRRLMQNEHIFALHNSFMHMFWRSQYDGGTNFQGTTEGTATSGIVGMFGGPSPSGTNLNDIRRQLWSLTVATTNPVNRYSTNKYRVPEGSQNNQPNNDIRQRPMLRISEMYFIAIEAGDVSTGQKLWDEFADSRRITRTTLSTDLLELRTQILVEFRKELYAEGQLFYFYKRLNSPPSTNWGFPVAAPPHGIVFGVFNPGQGILPNYFPPIPLTELRFENRN